MTEHTQLKKAIRRHTPEVTEGFFGLVKEVLEKYDLASEHPGLGLTVRTTGTLAMNIGKRWAVSLRRDGRLELILPFDAEGRYEGEYTVPGTTKGVPDCTWLRYSYDGTLPAALKSDWLKAVHSEIERGYRTPFKKYHSTLFYDVVTDADTRKGILESKEN